MIKKICYNCKHHQVFWDEGYGPDGCVCNSKSPQETHLKSCPEYEIGDLKECPVFEPNELAEEELKKAGN